MDNLEDVVDHFFPNEMKYLNFHQSSQLSGFCESTSINKNSNRTVHSISHPVKNAWYEEPQAPVTIVGQTPPTTPFITGIQKSAVEKRRRDGVTPSKHCYDSHFFLPAVSQEDSKLIGVDFVCDLVVAYYGAGTCSEAQVPAIGMALYCVDSRSYSYVR